MNARTAEIERILAMTEDQLRRECVASGEDFDQVAAHVAAVLSEAVRKGRGA